MSYRHSGSKTFFSDEWKDTLNGVRCTEHKDVDTGRSLCHKVTCDWLFGREATWNGLRVPLKVSEICPGTGVINRKILNLFAKAMWFRVGWIEPVDLGSSIEILGDSASIFKTGRLTMPEGEFATSPFTVNLSLDTISEIDFKLWQKAQAWGGTPGSYIDVHVAEIKIDWEWYSEVAPILCGVGVAVRDADTNKSISRALVRLMSGARLVASKYTDGGRVDFSNIETGSYTLKASIGGYEPLERSIVVEPPAVDYTVSLVPIPVPPLPDWVWYVVAGIGGLTAIVTIPRLIPKKEKPEKPPVYIVK